MYANCSDGLAGLSFHHASRSKAAVMSTVSATAAECALAGGDARRRWLMVTMPRITSRRGQSGHEGWFGGPLAAGLHCQAIGYPLRRQLCIIGWCSVGRGGMKQHDRISKRGASANKCIPPDCAIKTNVQRASNGAFLGGSRSGLQVRRKGRVGHISFLDGRKHMQRRDTL